MCRGTPTENRCFTGHLNSLACGPFSSPWLSSRNHLLGLLLSLCRALVTISGSPIWLPRVIDLFEGQLFPSFHLQLQSPLLCSLTFTVPWTGMWILGDYYPAFTPCAGVTHQTKSSIENLDGEYTKTFALPVELWPILLSFPWFPHSGIFHNLLLFSKC